MNKYLISEFLKYLVTKEASTNYQRNCIKIILMFIEFKKETCNRGKISLKHFVLIYIV